MSQSPPSSPELAARIAHFLARFPPFSYLPARALEQLCGVVTVRYAPSQTEIFRQGERPERLFYVVRKGAVRLFRNDEGQRLVDQLDEGDVFGLRPWLSVTPVYSVTARTSEESLLYGIPYASFEPLVDVYPRIGRYLATSFASGVRNPERLGELEREESRGDALLLDESPAFPRGGANATADLTRVPASRPPVTLGPQTAVRRAAEVMSAEGVGSVIVVDTVGRPLGVVTDRDLRRLVVTGLFSREDTLEDVMQQPPVTIAPDQRAVDVQLAMVRQRVRHLVVTADGTAGSPVVGVVSNRDLLLALGSSPAAVVAEIETANSARELRQLRERAEAWLRPTVEQRGSVYAAAKIMTEVNDELTRRAVALALGRLREAGHEPPAHPFCWLALGSHGRGEQLLRTDQDHAIVFADADSTADAEADAAELEAARSFLVELAAEASAILGEVGFERCVGDMMAANPAWCLTVSEWRERLADWAANPTGPKLLNASTLLDRRPVYGALALGEELVAWSAAYCREQPLLLAFLAKAATDNPPPLSFFRNFVVERGGEHEDEFDVKQRAMLPLADAARVLTLAAGVPDPPNTVDRFDRLGALEPQNAELYEAAAQAYDTLMGYRARQGFADGGASDGRYFRIRELGKLERLQLRNAFRPAEDLLQVLRLRFQLTALNQ